MPRTLGFPQALSDSFIGARVAIHALARGLCLLAREYSLAEVATAKSGLFRQRRAEIRALYGASMVNPQLGSVPGEPVRDPASRSQNTANLSPATAGRTR